MSLLFRIVYATHANGTHHKLALDALNHLRGPDADAWRKLFLKHAEDYLEGSKAPDKEFKDFTNHVLHVRDGYWGGAAEKATSWYGHVVDALRAGDWKQAVYAAGVLSHYYTDPIMPFHTAQSEAENNIHRAGEWSISKSYNDLNRLAKSEFPVPDVLIEDRDDWVADLVCDAAEISNSFYEQLIANYDLDRGVVDPPAGLNERARRIVAQLLAYAQVGQARILERAFIEAGATPPEVTLTAKTVVAGLKIPLKWVVRKLSDAGDRALVNAMYDELQATGSVEKTLPEDDRVVRDTFRREVSGNSASKRPAFRPSHAGGAFDYTSALKIRAAAAQETESPAPASKSGPVSGKKTANKKITKPATPDKPDSAVESVAPASPVESDAPFDAARALHERAAEMSAADTPPAAKSSSTPGFRLHRTDEVDDGPSVGPKTALRLNKIGIVTVDDLLNADPAAASEALNVSYVQADTIVDWQDQARIQCDVPGLSGTAAQLIVGAGIRSAAELAGLTAEALAEDVAVFADTAEGSRLLRDRAVPELSRIAKWIANAAFADASKAA